MGASALWLLVPAIIILGMLALAKIGRRYGYRENGPLLPWWAWLSMAPIFLVAMVNGLGEDNNNRAWGAGVAAASVLVRATVSYLRSRMDRPSDSS